MHGYRLFSVLCLVLFGISTTWAATWAVLVAGSSQWENYRHQADVCHAYQILHTNGIPDSNIIVMMYDDLAHHWRNPTKGVIINHPKGKDVYHGVPHDYTGKDVTPENFINVLLGNKEAMRNVGSGKVLESGPDDNVFVYFTDHGATGLVAFPSSVLYSTDLNKTITTMYNQKKYKQMVIYIEACESGSMLEDVLSDEINVYGTTASSRDESSYACYHDTLRGTYLGDVYSVVWMEDSDVEQLDKETLFEQYSITKNKTNTSHVMQYGNLSLAMLHYVSEFQGAQKSPAHHHGQSSVANSALLRKDAVRSEDVRLELVKHRLALAEENSTEKQELQNELTRLEDDRKVIFNTFYQIASNVLSSNHGNYLETVMEKHMKLTQHNCYVSVTKHVQEKCFDLPNEFVLNKLYIMANLCEIGLSDFTVNQAIDQICKNRIYLSY